MFVHLIHETLRPYVLLLVNMFTKLNPADYMKFTTLIKQYIRFVSFPLRHLVITASNQLVVNPLMPGRLPQIGLSDEMLLQ